MSKLFKFYPALLALYSLLPLSVNAAEPTWPTTAGKIIRLVGDLTAILFAIAAVIFLWGVIQFIVKSGDEAAREKAKGIMTWGIIGLAVMASVWGLTNILVEYFGTAVGQPSFQIPVAPPLP